MLVAFLLHQGSPNDDKLYEEILEELKRRKIARDGDTIIFDKGYSACKNYAMGISRFKVISVIFPRKNFKMEKLMAMLSYPLSIFNRSYLEKEKEFYRGLVKSLNAKLENWKKYKPIRGSRNLGERSEPYILVICRAPFSYCLQDFLRFHSADLTFF